MAVLWRNKEVERGRETERGRERQKEAERLTWRAGWLPGHVVQQLAERFQLCRSFLEVRGWSGRTVIIVIIIVKSSIRPTDVCFV